MPVRDGLPWLEEQLEALCAQEYDEPWEVVVADNGSSDGSIEVLRSWSGRCERIRLVDASAVSGQAAARNLAASRAGGEFLAFCDADDVVRPGWLRSFGEALAHADVVAGAFDMSSLNGASPASPAPAATRQMGFLPFGLSSNLAVRREAFESAGGFSEELSVGEDADLCWRLQLEGCTFDFAPGAVVAKRERATAAQVFRRAVDYGRSGALLYKRYRPFGARRDLSGWTRSLGWIVASCLLLPNRAHRRRWMRAVGMRLGRIMGSVEQRVFFP